MPFSPFILFCFINCYCNYIITSLCPSFISPTCPSCVCPCVGVYGCACECVLDTYVCSVYIMFLVCCFQTWNMVSFCALVEPSVTAITASVVMKPRFSRGGATIHTVLADPITCLSVNKWWRPLLIGELVLTEIHWPRHSCVCDFLCKCEGRWRMAGWGRCCESAWMLSPFLYLWSMMELLSTLVSCSVKWGNSSTHFVGFSDDQMSCCLQTSQDGSGNSCSVSDSNTASEWVPRLGCEAWDGWVTAQMALLDSRPCRYCARMHPVLLPFRHDIRVIPGLSAITNPFQFWRAAVTLVSWMMRTVAPAPCFPLCGWHAVL